MTGGRVACRACRSAPPSSPTPRRSWRSTTRSWRPPPRRSTWCRAPSTNRSPGCRTARAHAWCWSPTDHDGTIAGYAAISPYRDRAAYSTTVEDSVYVHPDHQGRGIGRLLLDALVDTARAHGFHAMMARVVADHEASIALHGLRLRDRRPRAGGGAQVRPLAGRDAHGTPALTRNDAPGGAPWWAGKDSNLRRQCRQVYSLLPLSARAPTPWKSLTIALRAADRTTRRRTAEGTPQMPSFDITSEVDHQEIRNAVDQATREVANRFDFKHTDPDHRARRDVDHAALRQRGSPERPASGGRGEAGQAPGVAQGRLASATSRRHRADPHASAPSSSPASAPTRPAR